MAAKRSARHDSIQPARRPKSRISALSRQKEKAMDLPDDEVRARYDALVDRSQECVFFLNLNGEVIDANEAARDMMGYRCDRRRPFHISDIVARDQLPDAETALEETILSGFSGINRFKVVSHDGSEHVLSVRTSLVFKNHQPHLIMGIARDVTEHYRVREELQREKILSAAGRAAADAAHQIKNKITVVFSITDFLLRRIGGTSPLDIKGYLRQIKTAAEQAVQLSMEMMHLATPKKRKNDPLLINLFLTNLVVGIQSGYADKSHDFELDLDLDEDIELSSADNEQLGWAFENIIINAIDAMPEGGTLSVASKGLEDGVRITISDTGLGIPPDALESIFEPFYTTKRDKGTGLGLSIAWRMVHNHDGQITVRSEEGKGTTFEITIPY